MHGRFFKKLPSIKCHHHIDSTETVKHRVFSHKLGENHHIARRVKTSQETQTQLIVKLQNIRSLFYKINFIDNILVADNVDLFFITETWLDNSITDSMIKINNFEIIRSDRLTKQGGGVALLYKNYFYVQELAKPAIPPTFSNFEFFCVDLNSSRNGMRFLCIYIPPDSSRCPLTMVNVCNVISFFLTTSSPFILLGDFNLPKINWNTFSAKGKSSQLFLNFCIENGLSQCITSPTHKDGNILDLVFCNSAGMSHLISQSVDCPATSSCDHNLLSLTFSACVSSPIKTSWSYPDFKSADFEAINRTLSSYNWNSLANPQSLQQQYDNFISILHSVIKQYVPVRVCSNKSKRRLPKYIRKLLKTKLKTYKLLKSGKCSKLFYNTKVREYEVEVRKWHEKIEEAVCSNPNNNKLYSYTNKKLNNHFTLPPFINQDGETISSDAEKADLLNKTFHENFILDDNCDFLPFHKFSSKMPDFQISIADINKAVNTSKDKLSLTPEQIPTYFIKRIISSILFPLSLIYNNCLKYGFVPHQWKLSIITPIFKKGDRRLPKNHRPIAQTSSFCRIFEAIISDSILDHVSLNNLILPNQFGFLPNRSSASQLIYCLDQWFSSYCTNNIQYISYTDISKAFDTVSHRKLVAVIQSFGINAHLTNWIQNFLTNRTQIVRIKETWSSPLPILSGVPQGSVLGPLLFILFMNDIIQLVELQHNAKFALFADDAKIFTTDAKELQSCLNSFSEALSKYQLHLAHNKCFILPISKRSQQHIVTDNPNFTIGSSTISFQNHAKDLGIFITNNLKWELHIKNIVQKASFTSYQITKSFRTKNIWTLLKLYKSYVRPKLEYNTPVWSPYLSKDISLIENVQRRYTKIICRRCSIPFDSYSDRLIKLNLISLHSRRIRFDLIMLFKIVNNTSDLNFDSFFTIQHSPYSLRGNTSKVMPKQNFNCSVWRGSFFERAPRYWNRLSPEITCVKSLHLFKSKLNLINLENLI